MPVKKNLSLAEHIGDKLMDICFKADLTGVEIAKGTSFSQSFVSRIQSQKVVPSLANLMELSKRFGVTLDYWVDGWDGMDHITPIEILEWNDDATESD